MDTKKTISQDKSGVESTAIDKKGNIADGAKVNNQIEQRKEQHQPRDNA